MFPKGKNLTVVKMKLENILLQLNFYNFNLTDIKNHNQTNNVIYYCAKNSLKGHTINFSVANISSVHRKIKQRHVMSAQKAKNLLKADNSPIFRCDTFP